MPDCDLQERPTRPAADAELERLRAARALHDAAAQTLFAAGLMAGALARDGEADGASLAQRHAQQAALQRLNRAALAELRMLMVELRPAGTPLPPLSQWLQYPVDALAGRGGIEVVARIGRGLEPPSAVARAVRRIAQEALANIVQHSGARRATLDWTVHHDGAATLRITDDGRGFQARQPAAQGSGLALMHGSAARLGAPLQLRSAPGEGCEITLDIHWNREPPWKESASSWSTTTR